MPDEYNYRINGQIMYNKTWMIVVCILAVSTTVKSSAAERPNIVWIVVDDMSANFSCYGESTIQTPNVDQLANEGARFTRAYATSPVCSTFRSAMITGMYQTSTGTHHHRSGRGKHRIQLPEGVHPLPELFQKAGYYTCIGSGLKELNHRSQPFGSTTKSRMGKTDYNFNWNKAIYDGHDWADRADDQPFFMQVQLHGGKLRGASTKHYEAIDKQATKIFGKIVDPTKVGLPPYYPRDSVMLKDWSTYLDSVRITDWHVGLVVKRLKNEGLLENTLLVFFTDHGISHARGKQFLYDEGTHIPLIIRGPGIASGTIRTDFVEQIDVAALSLAAAGIKIPGRMQGQDVLSERYHHKSAVFAARDRCGEAADRIRSVRTERFLYIKNFYPQRPHLMPSSYKDGKSIVQRLRALHAKKTLNALSEKLLFAPTRPSEELYLYGEDQWQTVNLANDPAYAKTLSEHRNRLNRWIEETGDMGPETLEVYDLETEDQIQSTRNRVTREIYRKNTELYKRWAREGK